MARETTIGALKPGNSQKKWGKLKDGITEGWIAANDPLTDTDAVQDKGTHATVADAVANAPGEGLQDVAAIVIDGDEWLHRWNGTTYVLQDDKAPVQTDATRDAFTLTESQFNARIVVPYRSANGDLQFYLPRDTFASYVDYLAAADFLSRHEAEGAAEVNRPTYIGQIADKATLDALVPTTPYGGRTIMEGDRAVIGEQTYDLAPSGWVESGKPVPAYETLADLPDPNTAISGELADIFNDPASGINGRYIAIGPVGAAATGWIK